MITLKNNFFMMHHSIQKGKDVRGEGKGKTKNAKEFYKAIKKAKRQKNIVKK